MSDGPVKQLLRVRRVPERTVRPICPLIPLAAYPLRHCEPDDDFGTCGLGELQQVAPHGLVELAPHWGLRAERVAGILTAIKAVGQLIVARAAKPQQLQRLPAPDRSRLLCKLRAVWAPDLGHA